MLTDNAMQRLYKLLLLSLNIFCAALIAQQLTRPPWLDELTSIWFTESPRHTFNRLKGDPHPAGFYLTSLAWRSALEGLGLTANPSSWPVFKTLMFITGSLTVTAPHLLLNRSTLRKFSCSATRNVLKQHSFTLAWILPALVTPYTTFAVLTDFRMYGMASVAALATAYAVIKLRNQNQSVPSRHLVLCWAQIAILGALHVWATLLAIFFAALTVQVSGWRNSKTQIGLAITVFFWTLMYIPGPMRRQNGYGDFLKFTWTGFFEDLVRGLTPSNYLTLILLGMAITGVAAVPGGRRWESFVFFGPVIFVVSAAALTSTFVLPIHKWYSPAPLYPLVIFGLASALRRFPVMSSFLCLILVLNLTLHGSRNVEAKQDWESTTQYALKQMDIPDQRIFVWPENRELSASFFWLKDSALQPLSSLKCDHDQTTGNLIVINHANTRKQEELLHGTNAQALATFKTGGVYSSTCG